MTEQLLDLEAATAVARAATQQPWRLGPCTSCGDVTIADVGTAEVCAAQAPIWSDGPDHEDLHEAQALADARHIATFDPPTVLDLLHRLEVLDEAVTLHIDLVHYLLAAAVNAGADPAELAGAAPEPVRGALALLVHPRLGLANTS